MIFTYRMSTKIMVTLVLSAVSFATFYLAYTEYELQGNILLISIFILSGFLFLLLNYTYLTYKIVIENSILLEKGIYSKKKMDLTKDFTVVNLSNNSVLVKNEDVKIRFSTDLDKRDFLIELIKKEKGYAV